MTIVNGFSVIFSIFIFLFCAALLLTSGCASKLKNSDSGICLYFWLSLGVMIWVVVLIVVAFINGIGSFWAIIVVVCWCLLFASLLFVTYFAYKLMKGGASNRYKQMV